MYYTKSRYCIFREVYLEFFGAYFSIWHHVYPGLVNHLVNDVGFVCLCHGCVHSYYRAARKSIGVGQIEAARSLGLSFMQMLRLVVIPQALRSAILPMTNLFIAVMLTTALGSQVPLSPNELTGLVSFINTRSVGGIMPFMVSALAYALTAFVIGFAGDKLDKKVRIKR